MGEEVTAGDRLALRSPLQWRWRPRARRGRSVETGQQGAASRSLESLLIVEEVTTDD